MATSNRAKTKSDKAKAKKAKPKKTKAKKTKAKGKPAGVKMSKARAEPMTVGWREWAAFPDLGVKSIKAKIDTGARTSALHAFDVEFVTKRGRTWVHFKVHPHQRDSNKVVKCKAPLLDERWVRSSNGEKQLRPVIETEVVLGRVRWLIEVTLTSRDNMGFRLLLGRQALRGRTMVNPGRSFLMGS